MITSIFSKSKPINFIIVFLIAGFAFFMGYLKFVNEPVTFQSIYKQGALFFICYISILILNFVVSKNGLTKNSNYEILLFSLFLLAISRTTQNIDILVSNFFVLLGLRRLISVRSQIKLNKKLFDAAFWFTIAALFYFWAILFFGLIIIALVLYTDNKLNHWIIPFIGVLTVFALTVSFSIILYNGYFDAFYSLPEVSYDFSNYNSPAYITVMTILLSFGVWSLIFYTKNIKQKKKTLRPSFSIILFSFVVGFLIVVFAPNKDGSEFLFMFAPLAIVITNYIEVIKEKWFKEIFLLVLIAVPFIALLL